MTERLTPCIKTLVPEDKKDKQYYRIYDGMSAVYLTAEDMDKIIKEYNKLKKENKK